jgi:hypothetical protein
VSTDALSRRKTTDFSTPSGGFPVGSFGVGVTAELAAQLCNAGLRVGRLNEVLPVLPFFGLSGDELIVLMKLCQAHEHDPTARFLSLYEACTVQHDRAMSDPCSPRSTVEPVEVGRAAQGADDCVRTDWLSRKIVRLTADLETAQGEALLRKCYSAWAQMPREQSTARMSTKDQSFTSMSTKWGSDLSPQPSHGSDEDLVPREEYTAVPLEGVAKSMVFPFDNSLKCSGDLTESHASRLTENTPVAAEVSIVETDLEQKSKESMCSIPTKSGSEPAIDEDLTPKEPTGMPPEGVAKSVVIFGETASVDTIDPGSPRSEPGSEPATSDDEPKEEAASEEDPTPKEPTGMPHESVAKSMDFLCDSPSVDTIDAGSPRMIISTKDQSFASNSTKSGSEPAMSTDEPKEDPSTPQFGTDEAEILVGRVHPPFVRQTSEALVEHISLESKVVVRRRTNASEALGEDVLPATAQPPVPPKARLSRSKTLRRIATIDSAEIPPEKSDDEGVEVRTLCRQDSHKFLSPQDSYTSLLPAANPARNPRASLPAGPAKRLAFRPSLRAPEPEKARETPLLQARSGVRPPVYSNVTPQAYAPQPTSPVVYSHAGGATTLKGRRMMAGATMSPPLGRGGRFYN